MKDIEELDELTQGKLKELLHYDPLSGIFTWLERPVELFNPGKSQCRICNTWNSRYANKKAGHIWAPKKAKTSYLSICISLNRKTKLYLGHRLAILYSDGHWPAKQVDHIDGDGTNNRRINLREVSALENNKNMPMQLSNTSGCVGVHWDKKSQKWRVQINVDGKQINGGFFTNIDDATARRKALEIEYGYHTNHGRTQGDK